MFAVGRVIKQFVSCCWNLGDMDMAKEQVNVKIEEGLIPFLQEEVRKQGLRSVPTLIQNLTVRFAGFDPKAQSVVDGIAADTGLEPYRVLSAMVARWCAYQDAKGETGYPVSCPEFGQSDEPLDYDGAYRDLKKEIAQDFREHLDLCEEVVFLRGIAAWCKAKEMNEVHRRYYGNRVPLKKLSKDELVSLNRELVAIEKRFDFRQNEEWNPAGETGE